MRAVSRSRRSTVVLFTAAYPYGTTWETFLDLELRSLVRTFERIIVVPSSRAATSRPLPTGVRVAPIFADLPRSALFRQVFRHPLPVLSRYARAVVEEQARGAYLRHPRIYLGTAALNQRKHELLQRFIANHELQGALFYDYWLANSTVALARLRQDRVIERVVARAHGFDVYDERWPSGAVPYRGYVVEAMDHVFAVSRDGRDYLAERHPGASGKISVSHLGVVSQPISSPRRDSGAPHVVSCASLLPVKRVHLIPDVLARLGRPLRWTHFGDGPCRPEVERAAAALPGHVEWRLAGHLEQRRIIDFYKASSVDAFILLSSSEGVPVSIMEAISFGIPVVATGVGGVPEIVTPQTGALVAVDAHPDEIASRLSAFLDGRGPSANEVRGFFSENFDGEKNYSDFAQILHEL